VATNFINKRVKVGTYKQSHDTRCTTKWQRLIVIKNLCQSCPMKVARSGQVLPLIYLIVFMNST